MTLAMTLGMSIGVKRTLWMMWGEVLGVATVAIAAVIGVASVMIRYPDVFAVLKWLGGGYLIYLGIGMWRASGAVQLTEKQQSRLNPMALFTQGYVTAIANPKGWAFMVSLLPPFINPDLSLPVQLSILVAVIMFSEFICMMLYASGGKTLARMLQNETQVKRLNQVSGGLMMAVGVWLALS